MKHLMCLLLLTSCGALPWNAQNHAGISEWDFRACVTDNGAPYPCRISVINGKEGEDVTAFVKMPDGTEFSYTATKVRAFRGQEIRAEVEKVVAEKIGDTAPGLVDAIIDAIGP